MKLVGLLPNICILAALAGCANLGSISRQTSLPGTTNRPESAGKAIHLDAKQRLVIAKRFGIVCAEPSPDALAAYAASFGGGVSVPEQGAASFAQAYQETAGSIGLRTQSITLMRDILYRVCEAYYGRAINSPQVMEMLSRSQDLTLALLAVEQLTGAIAARQVTLGGASSAGATSNLAFIQGLLDNARQYETQKESERAAAEKERDNRRTTHENAIKAVTEAEKTDSTVADDERQRLRNARDAAQRELGIAQQKLDTAAAVAGEAKKTRESIEKNHTSALTSANATASGSGVFASPIQPVTLDQKATEHIASAVKEIVRMVVQKSYTADACLAFITRNEPDLKDDDLLAYRENVSFCKQIIAKKLHMQYVPVTAR